MLKGYKLCRGEGFEHQFTSKYNYLIVVKCYRRDYVLIV
jgi:hypothetical protein